MRHPLPFYIGSSVGWYVVLIPQPNFSMLHSLVCVLHALALLGSYSYSPSGES